MDCSVTGKPFTAENAESAEKTKTQALCVLCVLCGKKSDSLRRCAELLVEVGKALTFFRELFEQWRWLPPVSVLLVKFADTLVHFLEADGVRVPHWTAAVRRKAVTGEINDVDVHRSQRVTFFQNARAFVHQRVDTAIDDLFGGNLALLDAGFAGPLAHEPRDFRIGNPAALRVVLVPARAGLLSVAPEFAETVFSN